MTYSLDFRKKALLIKEKENLTFEQTAERFGIGIASLVRWSNRLEPKLTRNKPATKIDMDALAKDVEMYPNAYQYERAQRFNVSQRGICDALKRLKANKRKTTTKPRTKTKNDAKSNDAQGKY